MTVASGRNAIFGDAVARLLEARGHRVTREYYVNDCGNQVRVFAESVRAAAARRRAAGGRLQGRVRRELAAWLARPLEATGARPRGTTSRRSAAPA